MFEDFLLDPNAGAQSTILDWYDPEPLSEPTPEEMQRYEEALNATDAWLMSSYNLESDAAAEYASTLSAETLINDIGSDLRSGNEEAWSLMWEVAEMISGVNMSEMPTFLFDYTFDALMDFAFGEDDWDWRGEWSDCPEDYL